MGDEGCGRWEKRNAFVSSKSASVSPGKPVMTSAPNASRSLKRRRASAQNSATCSIVYGRRIRRSMRFDPDWSDRCKKRHMFGFASIASKSEVSQRPGSIDPSRTRCPEDSSPAIADSSSGRRRLESRYRQRLHPVTTISRNPASMHALARDNACSNGTDTGEPLNDGTIQNAHFPEHPSCTLR